MIEIIKELSSSSVLHMGGARIEQYGIGEEAWRKFNGGVATHFAIYADGKDLREGELVLCQTMQTNQWSVGFVASAYDPQRAECLIREIGSDKLCHVSNERFIPIRGSFYGRSWMLEGEQRKFYEETQKASRILDGYIHVFTHVTFDGDAAFIHVRRRHGGIAGSDGMFDLPYKIQVDDWRGMKAERIAEIMDAAGFEHSDFAWKKAKSLEDAK